MGPPRTEDRCGYDRRVKICLVSTKRFDTDRRSQALFESLQRSGHDVFVVSTDPVPSSHPVTASVQTRIGPAGRPGNLIRRVIPSRLRDRVVARRLATEATKTTADIFIPVQMSAVAAATTAARTAGGVVHRTPLMPRVGGGVDLIDLAPQNPGLSRPAGGDPGGGEPFLAQHVDHPAPERFQDRKVVLCYRRTETNPGRYLENALKRSGATLRIEIDAIDLSTVDTDTDFIIFVESPYPALDVSGRTDVPTLLWVHHGEHHLSANLRLVDRYRVDAVLMAHSWHLAYRFPVPVHRFPFGLAPELSHPSIPLSNRDIDVAFVGAHAQSSSWQYHRRAEMIENLRQGLPRLAIRIEEKVSPEAMAKIYGNSRIVLNDGGVRHYPITMRVFEAIASGAVLLSDLPPGIELLFTPGDHFAIMGENPVENVERILADLKGAQEMANAALEHGQARHTYDHRVDQLFLIADATVTHPQPDPQPTGDMAFLIDSDVEIQNIIQHGLPDLRNQLATRAVWSMEERLDGRLRPASVDAVAIAVTSVDGFETLLSTARRLIYSAVPTAGLDVFVRQNHPNADIERHGDILRIDLMADAYRVASGPPQQS